MTLATALAALVDFDRYPIHDLESEPGRALVERCRRSLEETGAADLEGFLSAEAVEATLVWTRANLDLAYRTESEHSIYFTDGDPALGPDHPQNTRRRTAKGGIAYDQIPETLPLRSVYESDELTSFVGAAVGVDPLYRHADPLGALNVMVYEPGDELAWHFDNSDFVVTLMLQPSEAGGEFEYVPRLRSPEDENVDGVRRLLDGDRTGIHAMSNAPGTLALFRGHLSPHRVTPVEGSRARINAVLSYAERPDALLADFGKQLFYGRVQ